MKRTDNFIQLIIYGCANKTALIFKLLKITPNQITFASALLNIISLYFLSKDQINYFLMIWYVSHFLDYCDGSLARLTDNKTKILLRVDHYSDLIKLSLTFTFISIYYSIMDIWVLNTFFLVIFFLSQIISLEFSSKQELTDKKIVSSFKKGSVLKNIYNIIFTFNGHTLFIIGFMFISLNHARVIYVYLILLSLKTLYTPLNYLINNKR